MSFTTCSVATNNISSLDDLPNDVGGLSSAQLKAAFDKFGVDLVAFLNTYTIAEANAHLAETVTKVTMVTEPFDQNTKTTINLGFRPKLVNITGIIINTKYKSQSYIDKDNQYIECWDVYDNWEIITNGSGVFFYYNGSNYIEGAVAFTDTGLEITWNVAGTLPGVSGNRRLIVSATTH